MISGSALRKQNHSISFSIQRCQTPGTKDSYTHPTTPSAGRTGGVLTCLTKSPELLLFVMPEEIKLKKYY